MEKNYKIKWLKKNVFFSFSSDLHYQFYCKYYSRLCISTFIKYWSDKRKTGDTISDLHFNVKSDYFEENTSYIEGFSAWKH